MRSIVWKQNKAQKRGGSFFKRAKLERRGMQKAFSPGRVLAALTKNVPKGLWDKAAIKQRPAVVSQGAGTLVFSYRLMLLALFTGNCRAD